MTTKKPSAKAKVKAKPRTKTKPVAEERPAPAKTKVTAPGKAKPKAAAPARRGGKSLVIVESPAKARTIGKYLGSGFEVRASNGHVRDLPKSKLGVDIEHGFAPSYILIKGKAKIMKALKGK